jgi:hypothetical protein
MILYAGESLDRNENAVHSEREREREREREG